MNAGRDVEQLITGWLAEEAADRAPDRVLDAARRSIDRTPQRRLAAAWREPMYLSPLRLTAIAAAFVVVLLGGAYLGRITATPGVGSQPSPVPSAPAPTEDAGAALAAYRAARDAICTRYTAELEPLHAGFADIFNPDLTPSERASKAAALETFAQGYQRVTDELAALEPPPLVARDHFVDVAKHEDLLGLINAALARLAAGDLAGAEAVDRATDGIAADIGQFELRNQLVPCP